MTQHPIQTGLPIENGEFDEFVDYCAHVDRSQAWVAREAIREYLTRKAEQGITNA